MPTPISLSLLFVIAALFLFDLSRFAGLALAAVIGFGPKPGEVDLLFFLGGLLPCV